MLLLGTGVFTSPLACLTRCWRLLRVLLRFVGFTVAVFHSHGSPLVSSLVLSRIVHLRLDDCQDLISRYPSRVYPRSRVLGLGPLARARGCGVC